MDSFVGMKVKHIPNDGRENYGEGIVTNEKTNLSDGKIHLTVQFENQTRKFAFPDCFVSGGLVTEDLSYQEHPQYVAAMKNKVHIIKPVKDISLKSRYAVGIQVIYYPLHEYVPKRALEEYIGEGKEYTLKIWNYKNGLPEEVHLFTEELQNAIVGLAVKYAQKDIWLVAVPTSSGKTPTTAKSIGAMTGILNKAVQGKYFINKSSLLRRTQSLEPAHLSQSEERPNLDKHLQTMSCSENIPEDTLVILIDDVITRGVQLAACIKMLKDKGAKGNIVSVVLGETVSIKQY